MIQIGGMIIMEGRIRYPLKKVSSHSFICPDKIVMAYYPLLRNKFHKYALFNYYK